MDQTTNLFSGINYVIYMYIDIIIYIMIIVYRNTFIWVFAHIIWGIEIKIA